MRQGSLGCQVTEYRCLIGSRRDTLELDKASSGGCEGTGGLRGATTDVLNVTDASAERNHGSATAPVLT